jgi:L-seryl-tRNA(Ser) seleniumtransferase
MSSELKKLPPVNDVLAQLARQALPISEHFLKILINDELNSYRSGKRAKELESFSRAELTDRVVRAVEQQVTRLTRAPIRKVINATGVILHTGLGRAPLGAQRLEEMSALDRYCNLEIELDSGKRGERLEHVAPILRLLTGADDAVVTNNNAAAVLLMLNSLARRKEVIVSRGELVEIGGSFRLPEVMKASGARMVEIGATNKTHLADYENAISERTAVIMICHPSNYEIVGFTAKPETAEIVRMAHQHGIPVIYDLGSGALTDMRQFGFDYEPVVSDMIALGVDLVSFSGDKLLGGPQAGIVVGRGDLVKKMRKNHLLRALRCDKITLGLLGANLRPYLQPDLLIPSNPTLTMFAREIADMQHTLNRLVEAVSTIPGIELSAVDSSGRTGSGAYPVWPIPSLSLQVRAGKLSAGQIARKLRATNPPVFGHIEAETFHLNMLTISDDEVDDIVQALRALT